MVLQQGPASSQLWGYADKLGSSVSVQVGTNMTAMHTTVVYHAGLCRNIWKVMLYPVGAGGPYSITVTSSVEGTLVVSDVMFGDVWVCSGQSNMQFTLGMADNASAEIADAVNYPDIRLFTVSLTSSTTELYDLPGVKQPWSRPSKDAVAHSDWSYFSAVCWLYGKYLHQQLKRPIGLLTSAYGGTPIEAWSSPGAMANCSPMKHSVQTREQLKVNPEFTIRDERASANVSVSGLWNAMVHPLLNMTLYGVLWYQGEQNAAVPDQYACRFKALIGDWRNKFRDGSSGQTDVMFPFGFVQLAPNNNDSMKHASGFAEIRWHQTCDTGYVPNYQLPRTFMAVAMDLPDFNCPYGSVHPRDKQDVAHRLLLSGLQVAYNISTLGRYQDPQITAFYIDIGYHTLRLEMDHGNTQLLFTNVTDGFEVCCSAYNQSKCDGTDSVWQAAPILPSASQADDSSVTIRSCVNKWTMGVRYGWRESPCAFKMCAVYTQENRLPLAPFVTLGLIGTKTTPHRRGI